VQIRTAACCPVVYGVSGTCRQENPIVPRNIGLPFDSRITMCTLRVNEVLKERILISREAAHLLEEALSTMIAAARTTGQPSPTASMAVDFEGIEGIAPSFLDELLLIFESIIASDTSDLQQCLVVANPPTRLSLKSEAVARGHGMSARIQPDGSWRLSNTRATGA